MSMQGKIQWLCSLNYFFRILSDVIYIFHLQNLLYMQKLRQEAQTANISNLSTGLQQANFQKAIEQKIKYSNRFYKGTQVSWRESLSHFKMYGTGIYLFFAFLKHVSVLFLILTVVSLPPIILNVVKGVTFVNSENSLNILLTRTSLGSHKYSIMKDNPYQLSIAYKIVNVAFDVIGCLIYLIFCLHWERKSKNIAKHIQAQIKSQSSHTLQVVQYSPEVNQNDMSQFMSKFGSVTEVVGARDYTQQIDLSKQIYELQIQIKQLQFEQKIEPNIKNQQKIIKLHDQVSKLYKQLDETQTRTHEIKKFYVQFSTPQQRNQVFKKFESYQKICKCCITRPQDMCLKGEPIIINKCNTQPIGILWQNAHFTTRLRIPRVLFQAFIILFIIVGGFIFISFLNILVPPIETDIDTSNLTYNQVKTSGNQAIKKAWCIQNYQLNGASSPYFQLCQSPWQLYTTGTIISICISIILMIFCQVTKKIVYSLADFQRFTTQAEKSVTIMTNMFIMNFLTTTLITFLMQANIFGLSVMSFLRKLVTSNDLINNIQSITEYSDLIPQWYRDIGYQIWFNIFIMIFLPQLLQPLAYYVYECLMEKLAKREKIHKQMVKRLQSIEFQFEDLYANILLIIATGFIFGGGIQLMMIVVFLCLVVRYFYLKYIFIRFCRVPVIYNEIINDRVIVIIKVILLLRCMISVYMYGAQDVFVMEKSTFMQWSNSLGVPVFSSIFIILSRVLLTYYYSIFILLIILTLIFKEPIFAVVKKIKAWRKKNMNDSSLVTPEKSSINMGQNKNLAIKKNENNVISNTSNELASFQSSAIESWVSNEDQEVRSQRVTTKSYRLQSNPLYQQILVIMKLREKKGFVKKQIREQNQGMSIQL